MKPWRVFRGAPIVALLAGVVFGGCGPSDPIDGTWRFATTAGGASATIELTFNGDHTGRIRTSQVNDASASSQAGCTTTTQIDGFHWTNTDMTLAYDGTSVNQMVNRSGCTNSSDNLGPISATGSVPASTFASITGSYSISMDGRTLTIMTMGFPAVFTRE